jgi:hypothetical protein
MLFPVLAQSLTGFTFSTFNAVIYTVCFLVPGFLMDVTVSRFFYKKSEQVPLILLRFLTFSCLNYAVWIFPYLLFRDRIVLENPVVLAVIFLVVIFISPLFLGLIFGLANQQQLVEQGLAILGFRTLSGFPSAWDYKFGRINEPLWVLVTLKDGSQVAGAFGKNSFASSESSERDLYLERVYRFSEDNPWQPVTKTSGILIKAEEIRYIEFWKDLMEDV